MPGGQIRVTASGVIQSSGKPQRVYGLVIESTGGIGGVVTLRNGGTVGSTSLMSAQGVYGLKSMIPGFPAYGMLFDSGLYIDMDANTAGVTVAVEQIETT